LSFSLIAHLGQLLILPVRAPIRQPSLPFFGGKIAR
jgi:hypothetical protein